MGCEHHEKVYTIEGDQYIRTCEVCGLREYITEVQYWSHVDPSRVEFVPGYFRVRRDGKKALGR